MSRLRTPVTESDHILGPRDALVTLVEYGDYECPYCRRAYWEVEQLREQLEDRLRFVFRNFPLSQLHPFALSAAEAAEAAAAQGRFWEMQQQLFEHQDALDTASLLSYADELGLDLHQFAQDLQHHRFLERVRRDFIDGARSGVNGTPTFFINDVRYEGETTAGALLAAIEGGAPAYGSR